MKVRRGFSLAKAPRKMQVAVLFGGRSAEHEISVLTALQAIQAIDPCSYDVIPVYVALNGKWYTGNSLLDKGFYRKLPDAFSQVEEVTLLPRPGAGGLTRLSGNQGIIPIDICFLAFHGQYGEDGAIQGLLELADLPYTGCGLMASAVAMNKYQCKMFLKAHDVPVLPSVTVRRREALKDIAGVRERILSIPGLEKFPLFVKPCHLGSSIGISIADNERALTASLAKAFQYDDEAIIEPCVRHLLEINVSVLDGDPPIASVVEIPVSSGGQILSYEDKYLRGDTKSSGSGEGMASLTRMINPTILPPALKEEVTHYALKSFSLLNCSGVGRFDFIYDKNQEKLYFNELNPIPGSLSFYLWEKSEPRLLYTEVINRLLQRALEIKSEQLALQKEFGFKALSRS